MFGSAQGFTSTDCDVPWLSYFLGLVWDPVSAEVFMTSGLDFSDSLARIPVAPLDDVAPRSPRPAGLGGSFFLPLGRGRENKGRKTASVCVCVCVVFCRDPFPPNKKERVPVRVPLTPSKKGWGSSKKETRPYHFLCPWGFALRSLFQNLIGALLSFFCVIGLIHFGDSFAPESHLGWGLTLWEQCEVFLGSLERSRTPRLEAKP